MLKLSMLARSRGLINVGLGLVAIMIVIILAVLRPEPSSATHYFCLDVANAGNYPDIGGPGKYQFNIITGMPGGGAVFFSYSGAPPGVSVTLDPTSITNPLRLAQTTFAISFAPTFTQNPRDFTLTLTARANPNNPPLGRSHLCASNEVSYTYLYKAPSAPLSFGLSVAPASRTVVQGEYTDFDITIEGDVGGKLPDGKSVTINVGSLPTDSFSAFYSYRGAPSGVITSSFQVDNSNLKPVFTITTKLTTPLGVYPVTITATGGGTIRTATVTLTVVKRSTFEVSVFPSSPQELVEGDIKGAAWDIKISWTGFPIPVVVADMEILVKTEPAGFEDIRRESIRATWVGNNAITPGRAREESLRLSLDVDRLPNSVGHKYPISYIEIKLTVTEAIVPVGAQPLTKTITLPPLKVFSVNADWSAALPANRLLAEAITPEITSANEPTLLGPDFKSPDVGWRQFDEEARMPLLVFKPSAPQIISWIKIGPVFPINPPTLRWEWIDPNGTTVRTFSNSIPLTPNRGEFWRERGEFDTLDNPGAPTGLWKVKMFLNEELIATQLFRIEAAPTLTVPPSAAPVPPPEPVAPPPAPSPVPPGGGGQGAGFSCARRAQANSVQVTTEGDARLDIGFILGGIALLYLILIPRRS